MKSQLKDKDGQWQQIPKRGQEGGARKAATDFANGYSIKNNFNMIFVVEAWWLAFEEIQAMGMETELTLLWDEVQLREEKRDPY